MGMYLPAAAGVVPPTGQLDVIVHLLPLSESESSVKAHGQTPTLDFVSHTLPQYGLESLTAV